jgi:cystathionine beta-lyase
MSETPAPPRPDTLLTHAGSHPEDNLGAVNPPVYRVSTVVFDSVAAMQAGEKRPFDSMRYGRHGTPTSFAFEEAVCALEGGYRSIATCSGQAAIASTLSALLQAGDHLLIADSVYHPTRRYCLDHLTRCGVSVTFYDPLIGAGISALIEDNTRLVYTESPGSLSFEIQDIPAIATAAHQRGALVVIDNTWATPLFFNAFKHGVDITVQAATKFLVGHSDAMLGVITCRSEASWQRIKSAIAISGVAPGSEEVYLGLRGMRTLALRLRQHQQSGLRVARWLASQPEVARVLHPALPDDPGHALWRRDFTGACGLFGVELRPCPASAVAAMVDGLAYFGLGFSWGGFESLILPTAGAIHRSVRPWKTAGPTLRLHIGLEDPEDLIADLAAGLARLTAAVD